MAAQRKKDFRLKWFHACKQYIHQDSGTGIQYKRMLGKTSHDSIHSNTTQVSAISDVQCPLSFFFHVTFLIYVVIDC